jgi:hypothetical protein
MGRLEMIYQRQHEGRVVVTLWVGRQLMIGMSAYKGTEEMSMKFLSLIPMAIFSLALQGQTGNVANGNPQAGRRVAAGSVSAELTKRIDTKNAKLGDEVDARVTSAAKLPDGTEGR